MIRTSVVRAGTAIAALLAVGAGIVVAAPTAGADNLSCLAYVTGLQTDNNQAIQYDQIGNPAAAASIQAGDVARQNNIMAACYYNRGPSGYSSVVAAISYIDDALSANNAGNTTTALSDEQTAAGFLATALRILNGGP